VARKSKSDARTATYVILSTGSWLGIHRRHPRKQHLLLTIKAKKPIRSTRVFKTEQVSKNRCHLEVKLATEKDIDGVLLGWLRDAYDLCS